MQQGAEGSNVYFPWVWSLDTEKRDQWFILDTARLRKLGLGRGLKDLQKLLSPPSGTLYLLK